MNKNTSELNKNSKVNIKICPKCKKIFNKEDTVIYFIGVECCNICNDNNKFTVLKKLDEDKNDEM